MVEEELNRGRGNSRGRVTVRIQLVKPVVLILACFVVILTISPALADEKVPAVMVSSYSLNPPVMSPDGIGTISIMIRQIGKTAVMEKSSSSEGSTEWRWSDSVTIDRVTLDGQGLSVLNPWFEDIGELGPDMSLPFTFTIRAPAKSGMYYPEVRILTSGGEVRYPIPVNVNTAVNVEQRAIIVMRTSLPDSVSPGDEIPVAIILTNEGGTLADKVILKVSNISTQIAPKSADVYYLGQINPGSQVSQDIVLLSDWDTQPGLISVPVTITFTLADGTVQTDTTSIELIVRGRGTLGLLSVETSPNPVIENQSFDMTVWIRNSGTGEARMVTGSVDLPFTGSTRSFIGTIAPGEDADAEFVMDGGPIGSYLFNATITYTDELGTHNLVQQLTLRVAPGDPVGIIVVIVVVLLILLGGLLAAIFLIPKKEIQRPDAEPGLPEDQPGIIDDMSREPRETQVEDWPGPLSDYSEKGTVSETETLNPVHRHDRPGEMKTFNEQECAVQLVQAAELVERSDFRRAQDVCDALTEMGYTSPRLLNLRAACRFASGDLPGAASLLEEAVALDPSGAYLWENLGSIYRKAGLVKKADSCEETGRKLREERQ